MATKLTPVLNGEGRVWIQTDGAGCGSPYIYHNCAKLDALDKPLGDITPIYCPDPDRYDQFVEVGSIKGADSRATTTMTSRLTCDTETQLEIILRKGCAFNMSIHYGKCTRPTDFNQFDCAFVFQDVRLTSYGLSALTALVPDERAVVEETANLSIGNFYRVFSLKRSTSLTAEADEFIGGLTFCDTPTCGGECNVVSDGCQYAFALVSNATETGIRFTSDGGLTWSDPVVVSAFPNSGAAGESDLLCDGSLLHFGFNNGGVDSYFLGTVPVADIISESATPGVVEVFSTATSGFPAEDFSDFGNGTSYVFYAGTANTATGGELIGAYEKGSGEFTILSRDEIAPGFIGTSISVFDDDNVIIGGVNMGTGNAQILHSSSFGAFDLIDVEFPTGTPLNEPIRDVWMISENDWLISTDSRILCTSNNGQTWRQVLATQSYGTFSFFDDTTGYFSDNTNLYRTLDSGNSWTIVGTNTAGHLYGLFTEVCPYNPNFVLNVVESNTGDAAVGVIERWVN